MNSTNLIYKNGDHVKNGRLYSIIIKDLDLPFYIGVFDFEHESPQNVRINIELLTTEPANMDADSYDDVVCYASIIEKIKELSQKDHLKLVETLAEKIANIALDDKRSIQAKVKIEKTEIIKETNSVGIEIVRTK